MKPELNKTYIIKDKKTNYPAVRKATVIDLTRTTIKLRWEEGNEYRIERSEFENKYTIIEEINHDLEELLKSSI